jgi:hypothetical protein
MRRDIPLSELAGFLALPLVAVLATYRRDGDPVDDNESPYRGVEIRTTAQLLEVDRTDVVVEMSIRYLGRDAGEAYAAESADSVLIRLEPGHVRTWDFADEI